MFEKLAGVRDRPNPLLEVKRVQSCINASASQSPLQGQSPAQVSCPPRRYRCARCLCNQSLQAARYTYQNTPTDPKYVGKGAKTETPEPVKLQHVSTNENVNEDASTSASPQKGKPRSSESAFLTKKATKRAGYYLSAQHQKLHVQKTQSGPKHLMGLNRNGKIYEKIICRSDFEDLRESNCQF